MLEMKSSLDTVRKYEGWKYYILMLGLPLGGFFILFFAKFTQSKAINLDI